MTNLQQLLKDYSNEVLVEIKEISEATIKSHQGSFDEMDAKHKSHKAIIEELKLRGLSTDNDDTFDHNTDLDKAFDSETMDINKLRSATTKYDAMVAESPFYCAGAKSSIKTQIANNIEMLNYLNSNIENIDKDPFYKTVDSESLAKLTAKFTKDRVLGDGDKWDDLQSIGWHMGLLCYMWINSKSTGENDFDKIFHMAWKEYFSELK